MSLRFFPRRAVLLSSLFLLLPLPFTGCDEGGDGPDPVEVCPALCQKQEDCALLGTATYEECVAECLGFAENMLDPYLAALAVCTEQKTCAELTAGVTAQGICYEENVERCTTNTDDYVEVACLKEYECDGVTEPTTEEMDECRERMHADGNILICFEQSKVDELQACIEDSTSCTPNPINLCAEEVVGLDLGGGGHNPAN